MSEEVHNHTAEDLGVPQSDQIVLSQSTKVDPIGDQNMHTVATYLESLCKNAQSGNSESASEFFHLVLWATRQLEGIVEQHPEILRGVASADVPVILGQTGIQSMKDITAMNAKFGVMRERALRKDANPKIRELVDELALQLNKRRMQGADDDPSAPTFPISEILSAEGWRPGEGELTWKGWENAAKFLPPPSETSAKIWWEVAEVYLQERFSQEFGKWFEHPEIFEMAGKSEMAGGIDTDEARGTVKKGIHDRFFEAVKRLQAHTP